MVESILFAIILQREVRETKIHMTYTIGKGGHLSDTKHKSRSKDDLELAALVKSSRLAVSAFIRQPKPRDDGPLGVIVNLTNSECRDVNDRGSNASSQGRSLLVSS